MNTIKPFCISYARGSVVVYSKWKKHPFKGGHFFINERTKEVIKQINQVLTRIPKNKEPLRIN